MALGLSYAGDRQLTRRGADGSWGAREIVGVAGATGLPPFHFVEPGDDIEQFWIELACLVESGVRFGKLPLPQTGISAHIGLEC